MVFSVADAVVNVIGFMAGLLVASSWVPQIYRAHKRRSTLDLSFSRQVRWTSKYYTYYLVLVFVFVSYNKSRK